MTDPVKLVESIQASIDNMDKGHKALAEELRIAVKSNGDVSASALKKAEEIAAKQAETATAITEMQQKLADGVRSEKVAPRTLGELAIKSESYAQFAAGNTQRFRIEANTITGQTGSPPANSDTLVPADRMSGIIPGAFRNLTIEQLLPASQISSNSLEFTKEASFTNNAAETAEGDTKPESAVTFSLGTAPVRTIATWLKITKQISEDAPALRGYLDNRLGHFVNRKIDYQLLRGTGTGQQISGIMASGNYTAFTPTASENYLDGVNRMIEKVEDADYSPTGIIMHTADWHVIERIKNGTSDARYVIGDPAGVIGRTLWGLPVAVTNQISRGSAVVGAFGISHMVFNRSGLMIEAFEQDDVNVQKNLITIRAERRLALATFNSSAVTAGLLATGASR